ncbi:MAG: hypothetical protein ACTHJM_16080 [Marmoricola sp.]
MGASVKLEEGMKVRIISKTAIRAGRVGTVVGIVPNLGPDDFPVDVGFDDGATINYAFDELAVIQN